MHGRAETWMVIYSIYCRRSCYERGASTRGRGYGSVRNAVEKYRNTVEKYGEGAAIDKRQVMAQ